MLTQEIETFGRRIGLDNLHLNDSGIAEIRLEGFATLTLEARLNNERSDEPHALLLVLALEADPDNWRRYARALERCDASHPRAYPVQTALVRDRLIYAVRFDTERLAATDLENAFRLLLEFAQAKD